MQHDQSNQSNPTSQLKPFSDLKGSFISHDSKHSKQSKEIKIKDPKTDINRDNLTLSKSVSDSQSPFLSRPPSKSLPIDSKDNQTNLLSPLQQDNSNQADQLSPTFCNELPDKTEIIFKETVLEDSAKIMPEQEAHKESKDNSVPMEMLLPPKQFSQDNQFGYQLQTANVEPKQTNIDPMNQANTFNQKQTLTKQGRKRKTAKDDTCSDIQRVSGQRFGINYMASVEFSKDENEEAPKEGQVFIINRSLKEETKMRIPKRKMSATNLSHREKDSLKPNLVGEDENEFDLAQSLLTLQLNINTKQPDKKFGFSQFQLPSLINRQKTNFSNNNPLRGIFATNDRINHRESAARRNSNFAFNASQQSFDDLSNNNDPEEKPENDDDNAESSDRSVSLDDDDLNALTAIKCNSKNSFGKVDLTLQQTILKAENTSKRQPNQNQTTQEQPQTEEYESLVWGQSIWSTDIQKESKKQFIQNIQQMTGSDIAVAQEQKQSNASNPKLDDTDDFEQIQKNIEQNTQVQQTLSNSGSPPTFSTPEDQNEMKIQQLQELQMQPISSTSAPQQPNQQFENQHNFIGQANQYQGDVTLGQQFGHIDQMQAQLIAGMPPQSPFIGETQQNQFLQQQTIQQQPMQSQPMVEQQQEFYKAAQTTSPAFDQNYYSYPNNPVTEDYSTQKQQIQENQYANEYQDIKNSSAAKPTFNSGISVHSGGHVALPIGVYDCGPEYPDNASSNYTHHPYSTYGPPNQQAQSHPTFQNNPSNNYPGHNGRNTPGPSSFNNQNRAHIFINRHINRYMMNPIYKSRQTVTSLQMHKYSGIPWRGGSNQAHNLNMNAHIQQMQSMGHQPSTANIYQQDNGISNTGFNPAQNNGQILANDQNKDQFHHHLDHQQQQHNLQGSHAQHQFENFMMNSQARPEQKDTNFPLTHNQSQPTQQQFQNQQMLGQQNIQDHQQHLVRSPEIAQGEQEIQQYQQPSSSEMLQESQFIDQKENYMLANSIIQQSNQNAINAQPFYPKDYGEQQKMKKQINDSANILAAGNPRNQTRQKATPAIHVPIPIPIMRRGGNNKPLKQQKNAGFEQVAQNADQNEINNQTDRSIFMKDFYRQDILSKKNELDMRMQIVSKNLESKLIKAVEINDEDDQDSVEEEELTIEVLSAHEQSEVSVERTESILNKSINIKDLKHHLGGGAQINFRNSRQRKNSENHEQVDQKQHSKYEIEEKIKRKNERAAIFKKLQQQLSEFKTWGDMNNDPTSIGGNNASSVSPKRSKDLINKEQQDPSIALKNQNKVDQSKRLTPFKQDAKQYMDKVLNLMNIINEVDDLTNVAELKNKLEKQKLLLLKARAERDEFIQQLQKFMQTQQMNESNLKQQLQSYQNQLTESQNLVQSLNQNQENFRQQKEFQDAQIFDMTNQLEQLKQENHNLIMQNQQQQDQIQESAKIYGSQIQTITNMKDQMQSTIQYQHNQINQFNSQIEQMNNNNLQVQQNLNQQQIENQKLSQNLDNMENEKVKLEEEQEKLKKQVGHSNKKKSGVSKENDQDSDYQIVEDSDDCAVPLEEQLQNANQQIKDLQEYIKKRGMDDRKATQSKQDDFQDKFNKLKKQKEEMEREKDKIIHHLKDFIKNHNESILVGSLGSSMMVGEDRKDFKDAAQINMGRINDTSTIDGRSFNESFDNLEGEDIIRAIMNDYTCERCDEKEKIINNNENRIQEYITYIQKQKQKYQTQPQQQQSFRSEMVEISTQTETNQNSSPPRDKNKTLNCSSGLHQQSNTSLSSEQERLDQSTSLKACHQILLNNYVRQFKEYVDNIEDNESEKTKKMKQKINILANKQKITLFDEDEEPDSSLITNELIQDIMSMSIDMITDLLNATQMAQMQNSSEESAIAEVQQQIKIIEKIVEKQVEVQVFKTVEFGINFADLKSMQGVARTERKACHQIIVEIEKLMYEMNSLLSTSATGDQAVGGNAVQIFGKILDTYLQLPHRLKPIFDHCKKIETVLVKALKSQDEIINSAEKQKNTQAQTNQEAN